MPNPISQFINHYNLTERELREAFTKATHDNSTATNFFSNFTYVAHLHNGNPYAAFEEGRDLLNRCQAFDSNAYTLMHKGTPYYWLSSAAYLLNNFESLAFFLEAAVTEDVTKNKDPYKLSPALKFILLEGDLPDQAAYRLVKDAQARMQRSIDTYNDFTELPSSSGEFTLSILREKLLRKVFLPDNKWKSIVTTMISFSLEWDFRNQLLDIRPSQGTNEPFFIHLFKGCLLFESLLKNNPNPRYQPPNDKTNLEKELRRLQAPLGFHDKSKLNINGKTLNQVLNKIDIESDKSLPTAMQYTGWLRNTLGHNLGWSVALNKNQYQHLFEMVISSCLHAVACLY